MTGTTLLGPWVKRFLIEHLAGERNLAITIPAPAIAICWCCFYRTHQHISRNP